MRAKFFCEVRRECVPIGKVELRQYNAAFSQKNFDLLCEKGESIFIFGNFASRDRAENRYKP